jgi:nuclear pore complex protein Nup188
MELLVAVFEQCARPDLVTTSSFWLARCQEMDIIHASLDLFVHLDLAGSSDLPLLLSRKQPLYTPHVLLFHMALASSTIAAERLASEGILTAYSNTRISSVISSGRLDTILAELPGHRNPAHLAYCSMLSIVAMVIASLGRQNHYFDSEACGFVQLYGDQISRALSWTIGDAITLPLLEEIDQVVNLFYTIAMSVPFAAKPNPVVTKVLRVFTSHALQLLQQVNYAITHPHHLASLYEPVTHDERVNYEKTQSQNDLMKRPIVMHLIHRFFKLSSNILGTLIVISRADVVLSSGVDEWPLQEALVVPVSLRPSD